MSRVDTLRDQVFKQRRWIESCESNGKSYTGENGPAIREADNRELRRLETELELAEFADTSKEEMSVAVVKELYNSPDNVTDVMQRHAKKLQRMKKPALIDLYKKALAAKESRSG